MIEDRVYPRLKPEYLPAGRELPSPSIRWLTPEERDERARRRQEEIDRTWIYCVCCDQKRPPGTFVLHNFFGYTEKELPVCNGCRYGKTANFDTFGHENAVLMGTIRALILRIEIEARKAYRDR